MGLDVPSEKVRLLAEIGFMGIGRGLAAESAVVFAALRAIRPQSEAGFIGGALAMLQGGQGEGAAALLRGAPQTEAVLAFRAMVAGKIGDKRLANELVEELGFMRASDDLVAIAQSYGKSD